MNHFQKLHFNACIDAEKLRSHLTQLDALSPEEIDQIIQSYNSTRSHGNLDLQAV